MRAWTSARRRWPSTPSKIKPAGTVIWNGPVGWFEKPAFSQGTRGIAEAMASSSGRHRRRRRRDGRGGRAVRTGRQDDARLDRRRSVSGLRRGQEVCVVGANRRSMSERDRMASATFQFDTVGELLKRLGNVPPHRVRMRPGRGPLPSGTSSRSTTGTIGCSSWWTAPWWRRSRDSGKPTSRPNSSLNFGTSPKRIIWVSLPGPTP